MNIGLLSQLRASRMRPDEVACGAALGASARGLGWAAAFGLAMEMQARGLAATAADHNAAIAACLRSGRHEHALALQRCRPPQRRAPE